jgi:hypothetical protein
MTPQNGVLLEKRNFLYRNTYFITAFTKDYKWTISWTTRTQFTHHNLFLYHTLKCYPSFQSLYSSLRFRFCDQNSVCILISSSHATCRAHPSLQGLTAFNILRRGETVNILKSIFFWDMTPCSALSGTRRFGGTYRLHLQGRRLVQQSSEQEIFFIHRLLSLSLSQ